MFIPATTNQSSQLILITTHPFAKQTVFSLPPPYPFPPSTISSTSPSPSPSPNLINLPQLICQTNNATTKTNSTLTTTKQTISASFTPLSHHASNPNHQNEYHKSREQSSSKRRHAPINHTFANELVPLLLLANSHQPR